MPDFNIFTYLYIRRIFNFYVYSFLCLYGRKYKILAISVFKQIDMHLNLFGVLTDIFCQLLAVSKNIFDTCEATNRIKSIFATNFFNGVVEFTD